MIGDVTDAPTLDAALAGAAGCDFVVIDTPGADTELSRAAHQRADLIVTPMNDSFVDFDVLGVVDPVTLDLVRPSLYSETVWEARKLKAAERGRCARLGGAAQPPGLGPIRATAAASTSG